MLKENLKDGSKGLIGVFIVLGIVVAYLLLRPQNSLDKDLHNQAKSYSENGEKYLTYQGKKFICVGNRDTFPIDRYRGTLDGLMHFYEDDVLVSWNVPPFWHTVKYYSYSLDNPLFIYSEYDVFFREDFDYTSEAYVTLEEGYRFVFCDDLTLLDSIPVSYSPSTTYMRNTNVTLCSELNERIQIRGRLFRYDSVWYFGIEGQQVLFQASDEFVHGVTNWPDV